MPCIPSNSGNMPCKTCLQRVVFKLCTEGLVFPAHHDTWPSTGCAVIAHTMLASRNRVHKAYNDVGSTTILEQQCSIGTTVGAEVLPDSGFKHLHTCGKQLHTSTASSRWGCTFASRRCCWCGCCSHDLQTQLKLFGQMHGTCKINNPVQVLMCPPAFAANLALCNPSGGLVRQGKVRQHTTRLQ